MASQSEGKRQLQSVTTEVISRAPWQNGSVNSTTESLTQALVEAFRDATESVANLTAAQQGQQQSTTENVLGALTSVAGVQGGLGTALSGGGGLSDTILSGGSLLSPIISGLMSLFGSGDSNAPPPLTAFTMPPALNVNATGGQTTGGQLAGSDYGSNGMPRADTLSQTTPNVTVQVNAIDSRSFLDHSTDIASAVRQAILSSHSINDVLSEL